MELLAFGKTGWGDELFYATLMTIAVSITAMFIGFVFALIFTPLKLSKYKSLNLIGNFYTTVIRGVPELLVIYLFFFGGSGAIMYVASIFGYFEYIELMRLLQDHLQLVLYQERIQQKFLEEQFNQLIKVSLKLLMY